MAGAGRQNRAVMTSTRIPLHEIAGNNTLFLEMVKYTILLRSGPCPLLYQGAQDYNGFRKTTGTVLVMDEKRVRHPASCPETVHAGNPFLPRHADTNELIRPIYLLYDKG
jgi:hypothetical protein